MREKFTAYITKYALTNGISECEVEDCSSTSDDLISVVGAKYMTLYHKPDWHRSRVEAIARAETMRLRKIKSLEASLAKFKTMDFTK